MEIAYSTANIEKNTPPTKDNPSSPEGQMEGYVGVLRSHADEGTQHVTQTQENEPVLVRDVTSTGHLYQPILVENTYP